MEEEKMGKLFLGLNDERVKGIIAIVAAIVMYFTPDQIDKIIEMCLAGLGISKLVISKE